MGESDIGSETTFSVDCFKDDNESDIDEEDEVLGNHPPPLLNNAASAAVVPIPNNNNSVTNSDVHVSHHHNNNYRRPVTSLSPLPPFSMVHAMAESPISAYTWYLQGKAASIPQCVNGTNLIIPLPGPISAEDMAITGASARLHAQDTSCISFLYDFEELEGELDYLTRVVALTFYPAVSGNPVTLDSGNCCRSVKLSGEEIGVAKLSGFREWLSLHPLLAESDGVEDLDLHPSSQRMIIFAHHHSVLDGIQEFICEKGISFVRIDGKTLDKDRQTAVQSFQSSAEIKIAIIGLTAGGAGLDLSSARNVVFLELPQNPSWMNQGESRAHRRGQTRAVNVYIFCAKDTTDESHWQNLNTSLRRVSSTTDGKYDAIQEILVENISFLETSGKTDRSCEDQILGKAACDTLSAETMKLPDSGSAKDLQPFEASGEVAPKINDRFEELCISDAGSSGKKDDLHNNAHMVSATAITKGPVSKGTSEENDSDTEIGSTGKVSPSKLNEGSEDTWRQEKEFTFHPQTIVDDVRPLQQIEPDESCFDQVGFLRFEVSQYTGRIHLYSCVPGTDLRPRPLFENFRQEELYSLNSQAAENKRGATFKGNPAYRQILLAFVNEWNSLRPIDRRKLVGKPLQLPLAVELGYLSEGINHNNGGLLKGGSKRRNTPLYEISQPLPSNAVWKKVNLCSSYGKKEKEYTQGWTLTDEPLCKLCQEPCMGNNAKTPEFFEDLFCNLGCYEEYRLRTSNQSIRQGLFEIEHGVCTHCQLDCHKLVKHIRPLSLARRQEYIEKVAPNVARRKNLLDKLVNDPNEGNAWHADHIVPVYRGGGECRLENMRTLCVACHSEVTAAQCAERRSTRAKAKKQLKVILSELRNVQSTEGANTNSEGHGHLQKQENILEDELLVNVPGSAYSGEKGTITGNEVLEEYKSQ
nr:isoform 4 of dna annealing helicase and endonuclease zranb3 [Quercus suber]